MSKAILEKQKGIENLRKAVRQAKTKLNEAARSHKYFGECLAQDPTRTHLVELIAREQKKIDAASAELTVAQVKLAEAEEAMPTRQATQFDGILRWFSGAALVKAQDTLELVDASVAHGSWIPGASRKVYAALKPNVAKKTLKIDSGFKTSKSENALYYAVNYGSFGEISKLSLQDATRELSDDALEFYIDFRPLVDALIKLDATRPIPVFTTMNASPTVSAELKRQGASSVEVAPIRYEEREGTDKQGRKFFYTVAIIVWPAGTKHNTSRYAFGTAHSDQCHACGHAIRNPFNWVPLVLTTEAGEKKSLWVGRDCSETLFGVKMDGELELAEGQR